MAVSRVNAMDLGEFVAAFAHVVESTPAAAEHAWSRRPFSGPEELSAAFAAFLDAMTCAAQVSVLRRHPELAAPALPTLTAASRMEQEAAGLTRVSTRVRRRLRALQAEYRARFGFPFVLCVRGRDVHGVTRELERRLRGPRGDTCDDMRDDTCDTQDDTSDTRENTRDDTCDTRDDTSDTRENTRDDTCDTRDDTSDTRENTRDDTCDTRDDTSDTRENTRDDTCDTRDDTSDTRENTRENTSDMRDDTRDTRDDMRDDTCDTRDDTCDTRDDMRDDMRDDTCDTRDTSDVDAELRRAIEEVKAIVRLRVQDVLAGLA